jgi:hypothetical protein
VRWPQRLRRNPRGGLSQRRGDNITDGVSELARRNVGNSIGVEFFHVLRSRTEPKADQMNRARDSRDSGVEIVGIAAPTMRASITRNDEQPLRTALFHPRLVMDMQTLLRYDLCIGLLGQSRGFIGAGVEKQGQSTYRKGHYADPEPTTRSKGPC